MSIISFHPLRYGNRSIFSPIVNRGTVGLSLSSKIHSSRSLQESLLSSRDNCTRRATASGRPRHHTRSYSFACASSASRARVQASYKTSLLSRHRFHRHHFHFLPPTITTMSKSKPKSKFEVRQYSEHKSPGPASPSASIILISPSNEILLLHRVQTSSAFPSAHVFPGGNLEPSDGALPSSPTDINRHIDSIAYRTGAIRELFEETGILLARSSRSAPSLLAVSREQRQAGRHAVHSHQTDFQSWLRSISADAVLDTDRLLPFTHWITPPNVPKRFSTQMYVYFVGLEERGNPSVHATGDEIETMAPEWSRAENWLRRARSDEIILFPPQFLLLLLISEIFDGKGVDSDDAILSRRDQLRVLIETGGTGGGTPPWKDKFISPMGAAPRKMDNRQVLKLDQPGPELKGSGLKGEMDRVVLVNFSKQGPRQVAVAWRKDVIKPDGREEKL